MRYPQILHAIWIAVSTGAIHELPLWKSNPSKPLQNRHVFETKFMYLAIAKSVGNGSAF
jgi:hypothetical protein